jgi:GAF domain-containing protein
MVNDEVFGELDIDSHMSNSFDENDRFFLEKICEKISQEVRMKG